MVDERMVQKLGYTQYGLLPEAFVKNFSVHDLAMSMCGPMFHVVGKTSV